MPINFSRFLNPKSYLHLGNEIASGEFVKTTLVDDLETELKKEKTRTLALIFVRLKDIERRSRAQLVSAKLRSNISQHNGPLTYATPSDRKHYPHSTRCATLARGCVASYDYSNQLGEPKCEPPREMTKSLVKMSYPTRRLFSRRH
jgi:hypothetical protein